MSSPRSRTYSVSVQVIREYELTAEAENANEAAGVIDNMSIDEIERKGTLIDTSKGEAETM